MRRRAVRYHRISSDAEGDGLGVARQDADTAALIEANGWELVGSFTDNDVSAFSGKRRPAYEEMLTAVKDGRVDVIVAWHPDRLHRSPRELEDFIDLLEATGATVATCTAGDWDLSTPDGRLMARITGSVARKESEDKSRRLRRKHLELAEHGRPNGGRAFGYDGIVPRPAEVELVREACARVLAGESLYAIVNDWTARAVPTVQGAAWSTTALRGILTAERLVGLRVHRGQVIGPAAWPAIVERETWEQVRAVLAGRGRARERAARSYLLTGGTAIGSCCERPLVAAPRPNGRAYACLRAHGGCGGLSIIADPLEELVADRLADAVDGGLLDRVRAERDDGRDLAGLIAGEERKLVTYAGMLDAGEIGATEWKVMRDGAQGRLDELRRELAARAVPRVLDGVEAGSWAATWGGWAFEQRRAAVRALIEAVVVAPSGPVGPRFRPERVRVRWAA